MKHNLDTDVDPTANHAERHGYLAGSLWRNRISGRVFVCINPSDNGAVWAPIGEAPAPAEGLSAVARTGRYDDLEGRPVYGEAAMRGVGPGAGNVAPGDDPRIVGALQADANLSDLKNVEEARRHLGISERVFRLLSAETDAEILKVLGLGDIARRRHVDARQPKSDALTNLAGIPVGAAGVDLMRSGTKRAVLEYLGLIPGETLQRRSGVLDLLSRMEASVLGLFTAANLAAVRGLLEIEPGQAFGPPVAWPELREMLTGMRRDIDELKASLAA